MGEELLRLGERVLQLVLVGFAHPHRLAAQTLGDLDVVHSVAVQLG